MRLDDGTGGATVSIAAERLLFLWLSPSFPVGGFAYSQGLEMAVERSLVKDRAGLEAWLAALIVHGALRNDLIFLAAAHRAVTAQDTKALVAANALACALQPSAERYLETTQQGGSFLAAIASAWSNATFVDASAWLEDAVTYPVAVGLAAAAHTIPAAASLDAFAYAWASNQTSAAIRLGVVGQTHAQTVVADLAGRLSAAARDAALSTLDDVGGAALSADLCSLEHETQYSRLFRS